MKGLKYGRCGICDTTFKSSKEAKGHTKSKKHLKNIKNPRLMGQKIIESQTGQTLLTNLKN